MRNNHFVINDSLTQTEELKNLLHFNQSIQISGEAEKKIRDCRKYLDDKIANSDASFYGINTGFGYLQNVKIDKSQLKELQSNLIQSHACGLGEEVPAEIVKLMLLLKIKSLSYGHSGVQFETVQRLTDMYNENILPVIYTQGSLGASGDLAPLSHLCLPLLGMGEVYFEGQKLEAAIVLNKLGWQPISLQSKEGLALINGTQFMSAYGMHNLIKAQSLLQWADMIAAISFDAFDCVAEPLHEKIHSIRSHKGQVQTAENIRNILKGSTIHTQNKLQVQDPYSFRCIPQVHGATKDTVDFVEANFIKEINAVTDNPNIFPDED